MGIIFALISSIFTAVFIILMKLLGSRSKNPWIMASGYQLLAGTIMLVYASTEQIKTTFTIEAIIPLALAWICWLVSSGLNYMAVKRLEVSTNILFAQIALVISYIGAVIFFKDQVTVLRVVGAVLVIAATSLIFTHKGAFKNINKKGLMFRFIASTAFASAGLLDKHNLNNFSIGIYTALAYIVPGIIAALVSRAGVKEYFAEIGHNWKLLVGLALSSSAAYYCTMRAFGYLDTSLVFTIMNFATVITVIIGVIFFKERSNLIRKILALVIVVVAAILLNYS